MGKINSKDYVVLDVETNGLSSLKHDLLSISIYKPDDNKTYDRFLPLELNSFVETYWINGIDEDMLSGKTPLTQEEFDELVNDFELDRRTILTYGSIDEKFIKNYLKRKKINGFEKLNFYNFKHDIISSKFSEGNITKDNLCNIYGIDGTKDIHSGLNDCILEWKLFEKMNGNKLIIISNTVNEFNDEYMIPASYLQTYPNFKYSIKNYPKINYELIPIKSFDIRSKDLEKFDVIMITEECLLNTSVMNKLYKLRDKLLCVIIDEAHELNNYTNAQSANMLKALITKVEYVYALTATPIVSDQIQLAKLANMLLPKEFPSASLLAKKLTSGKLTVEEYPFLFINRKASELGRMSEPRGHVVLVEPQPDQKNCNLGGVKLFQVCKGYGAVNQVNALNDVIQSQSGKGLVYVSQKSIMEWVMQNMGKNNISAAVINGEVVGEVRKQIINDFAAGEYKVIITSLTTALDMDCDFVIFYEFTVEIEQMIGRAHRGLNNKDLDVYFIVTEDTGEINYFLTHIVMRSDIIQKILNKRNKAVSDAAERLLPNVEC